MHIGYPMPTITRIPCLSGEYGIGYTVRVWPETCDVFDAPSRALFGEWSNGPGTSKIHSSWAVWSLDSIPPDSEILNVQVEHYLWPDEGNDPRCSMAYGKLDFVPVPPPECEYLTMFLNSTDDYARCRVGSVPELRRQKLYGAAVSDVQNHLWDGSLFALSIRHAWGPVNHGGGQIPGWDAGGVDLIVTWRPFTVVEPGTWGQIKALFRD